MSSFFTIGHSNHEFPAWLALLRRHAVEVVVDTRSSPYSKYVPQFDKELMQRSLEQAGIRYLFLGAELGGRPANPAYYDAKGRVRYDLAVTDPAWLKLMNQLPAGIYPHTLLSGGKPAKTFLTISLSEPFEGFHYKLVAGVVCLPA
jgi:hypothetical protein